MLGRRFVDCIPFLRCDREVSVVWPRVKFSEAERERLRDLVVRPPKLVLLSLQILSVK